jgi:hypothetical protein
MGAGTSPASSFRSVSQPEPARRQSSRQLKKPDCLLSVVIAGAYSRDQLMQMQAFRLGRFCQFVWVFTHYIKRLEGIRCTRRMATDNQTLVPLREGRRLQDERFLCTRGFHRFNGGIHALVELFNSQWPGLVRLPISSSRLFPRSPLVRCGQAQAARSTIWSLRRTNAGTECFASEGVESVANTSALVCPVAIYVAHQVTT